MNQDLIEVVDLTKQYAQPRGPLSLLREQTEVPAAVNGISFGISARQTLGLVGESGCGKTTTGKALVKLIPTTSGRIVYDGKDITHMSNREFRPLRGDIQMIFQDLDAALNPKMRVSQIIEEAVRLHHRELSPPEVKEKAEHLLETVNLKRGRLTSFPSELSGGEKRRVGIARVLSVEPKFIVADEPTSALDVSIQAQIVNLLQELQENMGLTYLLISHDLPLVELIAHDIAVMYSGRIIEMGRADEIASTPRHPYTAVLWSALPEQPAAADVSSAGCPFAPRCPVFTKNGSPRQCTDPATAPRLPNDTAGHQVACHFPLS